MSIFASAVLATALLRTEVSLSKSPPLIDKISLIVLLCTPTLLSSASVALENTSLISPDVTASLTVTVLPLTVTSDVLSLDITSCVSLTLGAANTVAVINVIAATAVIAADNNFFVILYFLLFSFIVYAYDKSA